MKILLMGGTKFVGKDIADYLIQDEKNEITFLNRGISNTKIFMENKRIIMDRDFPIQNAFKKNHYNLVIDVSCYNINQLVNPLDAISFDKYIFVSSSAVNAIPFNNIEPDMREMVHYAYNKKECEDYIIRNFNKYLIFRPCYIVGENDYTKRFYEKNGKFYWTNGIELTFFIKSKDFARLIYDNLNFQRSGIINPCK